MNYVEISHNGKVSYIELDEKTIPISENNNEYKIYLKWLSEGNTVEKKDNTHVPSPEEMAKEARKILAKSFKDKVKNKETLSKEELATILESLMDLLG